MSVSRTHPFPVNPEARLAHWSDCVRARPAKRAAFPVGPWSTRVAAAGR